MKTFTLIPILGLKTDVLPDDDSMLKMVTQNAALSHAAGGENFDLKRKKNACTKSFGSLARSDTANAQATLCMGLFELYDGTNREHIYFDNGKVYAYDSSWDPQPLAVSEIGFTGQAGAFTPTNTLCQTIDNTTVSATIVSVVDNGTSGIITFSDADGVFQIDYPIYEASYGSELAPDENCTSTATEQDDTDNWTASNSTLSSVADPRTDSTGSYALNVLSTDTNGYAWCTYDGVEDSFYIVDSWYKCLTGDAAGGVYDLSSPTALSGTIDETSWTQFTGVFKAGSGNKRLVFYSSVDTYTVRYDDISVKKITNAAMATSATSSATLATGLTALYSIIRVGEYMVFADHAESALYKWKSGDAVLTQLIASGTAYKFRYLIPFQRRIVGFYSNQTNGNIDVRWSTAWPATAITALNIPAANQFYIPNDDPITGVGLMGRDKCFIFCENSIQQLVYYPDYSTPLRCYTVVPDVGAENHHSIVAANGRLYFFNRSYGFCEYIGGNTVNPISDDILEEFNNVNSSYYPLIVGRHIAREKKIKWTMPLSGTSSCDHIVSYNYDTGQWEIENKVARWLDEWLLYASQTWTALDTALDTWTGGGTTRWSDYTSASRETVLGHTDGYFYGISGESAVSGDMDGYREEPILHFGNRRSVKTIQEIWFDIGESRDFSLYVYHRSGNTTGEVLNSNYTSIGEVSCNSPSRAILTGISKVGRLHQVKWGADLDDEKFVINGVVIKYIEGSEV